MPTFIQLLCTEQCKTLNNLSVLLRKHSSYERKLFYYKDAMLSILYIIHV